MIRALKPNEPKTYIADFAIESFEVTRGIADWGSGLPHRP